MGVTGFHLLEPSQLSLRVHLPSRELESKAEVALELKHSVGDVGVPICMVTAALNASSPKLVDCIVPCAKENSYVP